MAHRLALLPAGYINLEYLLIGIFSVFLRRSVVFVLLFLESAADFAFRICYTYWFSLKDLFDSFASLSSLPDRRIVAIFAIFGLMVVACAIVARARPRLEDRFWVASSLLFLMFLVALAGYLTGQDPFKRVDLIDTHGRVLRAPIFAFLRFESFLHAVDLASHITDGGVMNSASLHAKVALDHSETVERPNVMLIVVESWGNPLDSNLTQKLNAAYDDPRVAEKYHIFRGAVAFQGSTIPAEARELCQSRMGYRILVAPPESLGGCLPSWFHARNYQDISIHGYGGTMFQRKAWYPKLGFDRSWFGPDLRKLKLPDCDGAFPGTCDAAIAGWIGDSLLRQDMGQPKFIYWVTLNSHLPVPSRPELADDDICSTLPSLRNSVPLCSWFRLVQNVNESVQQLALRPSGRPTVFVVVGDHAPPFSDPRLRQMFSSTDVPYVLLTPIAGDSH
jgi:hypothetical protein